VTLDPAVRTYLEGGVLSQSFLARMDVCPRSAYLYAKHRETRAQTHAMCRGEAFHDFAERAIRLLYKDGEITMDPDVARELMESVVAERKDLVVPHSERDALRAMAWNFGRATEGQPVNFDHLRGLEIMPELKIGRWTVRGKIDRVEVIERTAYIRDYKTSLNLPSQEKFQKSFQTPFYALVFSEGTIDGKRVGEGLDHFHVAEEYPRFISKQCADCDKFNDEEAEKCKECKGIDFKPPTLFKRMEGLGKRELGDFKRSVTDILDRLDSALSADDWPASPGTHCSQCAAPRECPIPETLRPEVIETMEEAVQLAQIVDRTKALTKADDAALKAFASEEGEIRYGDKELGFLTIHKRQTDKAALEKALEGGDINPRDYVKQRTETRFQVRTIEEES
jgi:hypothetical protein